MKYTLALFLALSCLSTFAQGKKAIKNHGIKSVTETSTQSGKTINESSKKFNKEGEVIEEIDYNKEGEIKEIKKYIYNNQIQCTWSKIRRTDI